jgi:hypothetical protein
MSDEKKSASNGANTRWWESYLVRYFSGAIVGAICLAVILLYADWRLYHGSHTKLSELDKSLSATVVVLALIASGLVYSYIISAPITVIHFGRSGRSPIERHVRYFWFGWVIALVVIQFFSGIKSQIFSSRTWVWWVLLLLICLCYLIVSECIDSAPKRGKVSRRIRRRIESRRNAFRSLAWGGMMLFLLAAADCGLGLQGRPAVITLMVFALPTIFVGVMQYVTLWRIFHTERAIHRFYRVLSRARTMESSKDIRETYTHLREHSNATFIVVLELCFSAFVIFLIELYAGQSGVSQAAGSGGSERMVSAVLVLVAFWMTPNLFMWSRANQIERDFARRPKLYSSNRMTAAERSQCVVAEKP